MSLSGGGAGDDSATNRRWAAGVSTHCRGPPSSFGSSTTNPKVMRVRSTGSNRAAAASLGSIVTGSVPISDRFVRSLPTPGRIAVSYSRSTTSDTRAGGAVRSCPNERSAKRSAREISARAMSRAEHWRQLKPDDEQTQRGQSQAGCEVGHGVAHRRAHLALLGQPDRLPRGGAPGGQSAAKSGPGDRLERSGSAVAKHHSGHDAQGERADEVDRECAEREWPLGPILHRSVGQE